MEGDKTPDYVMSEDDNSQAPMGDIADLTAMVSENASLPEARQPSVPSSARLRIYTSKKNKGIGKGISGSSGPPPPKRKAAATISKPPADEDPTDVDDEDSSDDEDDAAVATQNITVGSKRGYTYYPSYIFDVPPKKLKTDTLRKKLMISEIKRSETQTQFCERGMVLMGHLKKFLKQMMMSGQFGPAPSSSNQGNLIDHLYALNTNNQV